MPEIMRREDAIAGISSRYVVITKEGEEVSIDLDDAGSALNRLIEIEDPALTSYVKDELGISGRKSPPSINAMRKLEMVDYEPASDSGHFRFYPEGSLMLDLLEAWANDIAIRRLGAMKIETPEIYDWSVPDIKEQGLSFHERHYSVSAPGSKKEWVLRFAGDFGLFRMLKDAKISYRNLPMRIYELSKSFRYEKRGELSGLRRLRYFTMPDIHSFTRSVESGFEEYAELFKHYLELASSAGVEYAIVFRVVDSFYRENRDGIIRMVRKAGRSSLVEILDGMKHYWVLKNEFQAIDSMGGTCQLATVQLDIVDSQRYGIQFTDRDGKRKGCVICHSSIGSLERWIYSLIENALKKKKPVLPLWISPVQVRIIPVDSGFIDYAVEVQKVLDAEMIRSEIDDRNEKLPRKILDAEKRWIPYVAVVGSRESKNMTLSVNDRYTGERRTEALNNFIDSLKSEIRNMPMLKSGLPDKLSLKPSFV